MSNEYFNRNPAEWNILDFLNKCELEPFQLKIDYYIKCLRTIVDNEQDDRKNSAQVLLDRYRKDPQPDRKKARDWEEKRSRRQIQIHQPTFAGINGTINGNINGGTFTGLSEMIALKRDRENNNDIVTKRTKMDDENVQWPYTQLQIPPSRVVTPPNSYLYGTQKELINCISESFTSAIPVVGANIHEQNCNEPVNEPSDNNKEHVKGVEGVEGILVDLTDVAEQLQHAQTIEWQVGDINVSKRFRQYQVEVFTKAVDEGLTYKNIYEILALSSIMVLCSQCPYHVFTNQEWKEITKTNPYIAKEPLLPQEITSSLRDTASKHLIYGDVFMDHGESELNKVVSLMFNNLYYGIPEVAPSKLSEEEHRDMFIYPITRSFRRSGKEYELKLNRATKDSKQRPDLSCVVNNIPILNSEFKPLGHTSLLQNKDIVKAQLKARKSINQQLETKGGPGESAIFLNMGDLMESFFMDLQYDGLYRSWPFLTTKLVIDKTTIPLAEFAISHLVALEERVEKIAKDFKYQNYRSGKSAQLAKMSFMRELPDSPQIKELLN